MNDNYLWDKTGKPDPEIVELENELGTLRYKPRPLHIQETPKLMRRRFPLPSLAIAAAIATLVLGLAIWASLRLPKNEHQATQAPPTKDVASPTSTKNANETTDSNLAKDQASDEIKGPTPPKPTVPGNKRTTRNLRPTVAAKSPERVEAEKAKQQLLIALRVASSKLNLAQKRIQSSPTVIRNQHKVG